MPRGSNGNGKKLEVVLPDTEPKKNSIRFNTGVRPVPLTNLYLNLEGYKALGEPKAIKVTIEAAEG